MSQNIDISKVPCIPENFDPLFKLGLCFDAKKMVDESIKCYQKCVRIKNDDRRVWQCLGQAYFNRGSYVNACKCFMKAVQLRASDDKTFFEELRLGEIKMLLGLYDEASGLYQTVTKEDKDNVVAEIGLAKIQLFDANEHFRSERLQLAQKACSDVFASVQKVLSLRSDMILPYNIIANCCVMCAIHAKDEICLEILDKKFTKLEFLHMAKRNLLKALSLQDYQHLWFNLFIVYSLLYRELDDIDYLKKSLFCLEKITDA